MIRLMISPGTVEEQASCDDEKDNCSHCNSIREIPIGGEIILAGTNDGTKYLELR